MRFLKQLLIKVEKKLPIHVLNKQGKITAILTLHSDLTVVKVIEKSTA